MKNDFLVGELTKILQNGVAYKTKLRKRILVDFSGPNTAKEFLIRHLRETVVGDTTARMFEFLGHEVLRINHVGDWGTPFGIIIQQLLEKYPDYMTKDPKFKGLKQLFKVYVI